MDHCERCRYADHISSMSRIQQAFVYEAWEQSTLGDLDFQPFSGISNSPILVKQHMERTTILDEQHLGTGSLRRQHTQRQLQFSMDQSRYQI